MLNLLIAKIFRSYILKIIRDIFHNKIENKVPVFHTEQNPWSCISVWACVKTFCCQGGNEAYELPYVDHVPSERGGHGKNKVVIQPNLAVLIIRRVECQGTVILGLA